MVLALNILRRYYVIKQRKKNYYDAVDQYVTIYAT